MCEGQVRARSNPNSYLARARTREPGHRDESGWVRKNALQRLRLLRKFVEQLLPKLIIWLKPKAGFGDMANHDLTTFCFGEIWECLGSVARSTIHLRP